MAKDPAFLFYSDNFQSGTQFFTHAQVGMYIRLLCAQHLHGHLSEKQVLLICGTSDQDTAEILAKFKKDSDGKYYNERLENEIIKRRLFSESRAKNRLGKTKKDSKKKSKTSVKHLGNGNEDGNEEKYKVEFEIFRKEYYGTKRGLETEFETLKKHKDWKSIIPKLLPAIKKQKQIKDSLRQAGKFTPEWKNLQTWLNQSCWEEEIVQEKIPIVDPWSGTRQA